MNFFPFISIYWFSPLLQILAIVLLFSIAAFQQYGDVKRTGKMYGNYPPSIRLILVPIYEEVIFRGIIFGGLLMLVPVFYAVAISSVLFGLWHIKNLKWDGRKRVAGQVLWAGLILGPVFAYITLLTGSIWVAVILHYINNIWAPISDYFLKRIKISNTDSKV